MSLSSGLDRRCPHPPSDACWGWPWELRRLGHSANPSPGSSRVLALLQQAFHFALTLNPKQGLGIVLGAFRA